MTLRNPERWADAMTRVHTAGAKPTGPPAPKRRTGATRSMPDPTDNTTPRVLAELDQALADLAEVRKRAADAVRRLGNAQPGYPSAPPSTTGRVVAPVLEDRNGILHWSCPTPACARDPKARGSAMNDVDAQRAFLAHHADAHAVDPSTQPERYAVLGGDEALTDRAQFLKLHRNLARDARALRDLAVKYGTTLVGTNVPEPTDSEWCTSCKRANNWSARRDEGGDLCRWCADALRDINAARAEHDLPALLEVPLAAAQKYARDGRGAARHIDQWAGVPTGTTVRRGRKGKR